MNADINPKRRSILLGGLGVVAGLPASWLTGCGGGGGSAAIAATDTTPAAVSSSLPANFATSVARTGNISVKFSEAVSAPTGAVTLTGPHGTWPVTLSVANDTIVLAPGRPLEFGGTYSVQITSGVVDASGNHSAPNTLSFSTAPRNPALSLGALIVDSYIRYRWATPGSANAKWSMLTDLYDNGFEWMRCWVTTSSTPELHTTSPDKWYTIPFRTDHWSSIEMTGQLLRDAADVGFRLQVPLFLSSSSGAGNQPRPPAWVGLNDTDLAQKIQEHTTTVASYYKSLGLNIEVFEIGNETDFGLCGINLGTEVPVPPGVDPVNDPTWMKNNVWNREATLMKAAISGLKSIYPATKILLHVAGFGYSNGNIAPKGFFSSMIDLGVNYDIAGLSYPYLHAGNALPQPYFAEADFIGTLDYIATLGKRVQIVEFDYPAAPAGIIHPPSPNYPLTDAGQAKFLTDFSAAVRGKVDTIFYWYPDYFLGSNSTTPELESCGLFSANGVGRPGLGIFNAIAEKKLLT